MIQNIQNLIKAVDLRSHCIRLNGSVLVSTEKVEDVRQELSNHRYDCYVSGKNTIMVVDCFSNSTVDILA